MFVSSSSPSSAEVSEEGSRAAEDAMSVGDDAVAEPVDVAAVVAELLTTASCAGVGATVVSGAGLGLGVDGFGELKGHSDSPLAWEAGSAYMEAADMEFPSAPTRELA